MHLDFGLANLYVGSDHYDRAPLQVWWPNSKCIDFSRHFFAPSSGVLGSENEFWGGGVGFEGAKWHGRGLSYVPFDPSFSLRSNRQPPVAIAHRLRTAFQENQALELNTQALGLRLGT